MAFQDGETIGIDLGTSSSAVARLADDGTAEIVLNADDKPLTSSVIVIGDNGDVIVGPEGSWSETSDPDRVIIAIKRQMGNPTYTKQVGDQQLTPEILSAMILMKLKQDTEQRIGPVGNAVITVPYYFNDPCRKATLNAGRIAGLNVVDIINEPTAATLAYAWNKGELGRRDVPDVERKILVYDLGGGTFDVTLVRYSPTHFEVLATDGDTFLGGVDWTRRIVNHVAERFQKEFGLDPRDDARGRLRLMQECEDAKKELSIHPQAAIVFEHRGKKFHTVLTRDAFEGLTADLFQRTQDTTDFVLDGAGVDPAELDEIVLVGGSTRMPGVVDVLERLTGKRPTDLLDPQLAVAQGAAIHAAMLEARDRGEDFVRAKPAAKPSAKPAPKAEPPLALPQSPTSGVTSPADSGDSDFLESPALRHLDGKAASTPADAPSSEADRRALAGRLQTMVVSDVNSHSLGIEITDPHDTSRKRNHIMIPKNSPLPVEFRQRFRTNLANPSGILVRLLEGDAPDVESCTRIGEFRIVGLPPNLAVGSPVEVTYRYEKDRKIQVSARELTGNNEASIEFAWNGGLSEADIDGNQLLLEEMFAVH